MAKWQPILLAQTIPLRISCRKAITAAFLLLLTASLQVSAEQQQTIAASQLSYRQAAPFSHLQWPAAKRPPATIKLLALRNKGKIPISHRQADADYFNHGDIPQLISPMVADIINASQMLSVSDKQSDYQLQLIIDDYQLPYPYAPDDHWYRQLKDNADRWGQSPGDAQVGLTLEISGAGKPIETWRNSVQIQLSACDINTLPQPVFAGQRPIASAYQESLPGQAFTAALNFLLSQAIAHIEHQRPTARVTRKQGNSLYLQSDTTDFVDGEDLPLYFHDRVNPQGDKPAGKVKVVKAMAREAKAYALNIRSDHIRVGDWLLKGGSAQPVEPVSRYRPSSKCPQVTSAEAIR